MKGRQMSEPLAETRTHATATGRVNQKLRTRRALIEAAKELVAAGATPTLAEVADHAGVSKTTAYRYFASADDLIGEAYFDSDFPDADKVLAEAGPDPTDRVVAVALAVSDMLLGHERAMRVILRNALDQSLESGDGAMRFGRRRRLIDAALQPLHGKLTKRQLAHLKDALALVIGPESIIAARDVSGLTPEAASRLTAWAAQALVEKAIAEAGGSPRSRAGAAG